MVDLGKTYDVERIVIYNRCDAGCERTRHLKVNTCEAVGQPWTEVYRAENVFGGVSDSNPLTLNFGQRPKRVQFVKISIVGHDFLHLDEVEVFAFDPTGRYRNHIATVAAAAPPAEGNGLHAESGRSLGAIVALTRGYDDISKYDELIARNKAIYEKINSRVATQYPLLIWHEGNLLPEHQSYVLEKELNDNVQFIDVSRNFCPPDDMTAPEFQDCYGIGYRLMCKFHTFDVWNFSRQFEYILRVDEDCILESIIEDPFIWAKNNSIDYGFSILTRETHFPTNANLPRFVDAFQDFISTPTRREVYDQCFPYTNLGVASTEFFLRADVNFFLWAAASEPDFLRFRWGDLPMIGLALKLFSSPDRILAIPSLRYRHGSHGCTIAGSAKPWQAQKQQDTPESAAHQVPPDLIESARALAAAGRLVDAEKALLMAAAENPGVAEISAEICDIDRKLGRFEVASRLALTFAAGARAP